MVPDRPNTFRNGPATLGWASSFAHGFGSSGRRSPGSERARIRPINRRLTAGTAAAALAVVGFASPAMADHTYAPAR